MKHIAAVVAAVLFCALPLRAADMPKEEAGKSDTNAGAKEAKLEAKLVSPEEKAKQKAATVEVKVHGVKLVDPALAKEKPLKGQGHLHYRVDDGPIIATTSTKLSFHELKSGPHTFTVMLAANDHSPLGPQATLNVIIP